MSDKLTGEELVAAHKEITKNLRIATIAFPIILIVVIVGYLSSMASAIKNVDTVAIGGELANRAEALLPEVEEHLSAVAAEVQPALTAALERHSEEMGPQLEQRLHKDIEAMLEQAESDFKLAVEQSLDKLEERQREVLVREFPQIADDRAAQDKILLAIKDSLVKWAMRQLNTTFDEHLTAMTNIRETLEKSYTASEGEAADPEDALLIWLDLMNERVGGNESTIIVEDKPKKRRAAAPAPTTPAGP